MIPTVKIKLRDRVVGALLSLVFLIASPGYRTAYEDLLRRGYVSRDGVDPVWHLDLD